MKENEDQNEKSSKPKLGGWTFKVLPLSTKRQAVEEFLKGDTPIAEIAKKYGVTNPARIHKWVTQVEKGRDRLRGGYTRIKKDLKFKIVREVLTGQLTAEEALVKYDVGDIRSIQQWCSKFSSEIDSSKSETMCYMKEVKSIGQDSQTKNLEGALKEFQLRILGLETMIDVAEKEFKIEIRKKHGTKQSK
jgi:transposase